MSKINLRKFNIKKLLLDEIIKKIGANYANFDKFTENDIITAFAIENNLKVGINPSKWLMDMYNSSYNNHINILILNKPFIYDSTNKNKSKIPIDDFYYTDKWYELRKKIFKAYGRMCMRCKKTKKVMNIDHIKPRSKYKYLELEPSNMQVLCPKCNKAKSNKHCNDYRTPEQRLVFLK